jgi:GDP-mannose 6-dehydrogenase
MRVSVFGLGYVGCVSAACFARAGHDVVGVDVSPEKVALINAGTSPIVEPGLADLLAEMVAAKRLRATCSSDEAVAATDLALICVGTPSQRSGRPDFSAIARVGEQIGQALRHRTGRFTVVLRSTVLPGTLTGLLVPALRAGAGPSFTGDLDVAVNPEFMREGSSLRDFVNAPLTLVGCESEEAATALRSLYLCVNAPFVHTGVPEAEMIKYVSNAFHALKVCFANEIGDLCAALGADAQEVTRVFLMDKKLNVSEAYLRPGFAFGGSCLPKDVRALLQAARSESLPVPLLDAIVPSNKAQVDRAVEAVLDTHRRRVGIVGLAFKAGTDDLRESPMVALVETLIGKGCQVRIFDRNVSIARLVGANRRYIEEEIPHISSLMCDDLDAVLAHAEVLVIGNTDEDAARAAAASDRHVVIDLTRRLRPRSVRAVEEAYA